MQFGLIILLIQVVLIVHAAKTGRFWPWGYVILFLPGFGALAYVLVELLPEWFGSVQGQHARKRVVSTLDPGKRYRLLTDQLEVTDTIANRSALAEECLALGKFDEALRHYEHVLSLPLGDDAVYALGRARAQFGLGHLQETVATLDDLRARWPDYQSAEGHLLYARALEDSGRTDDALAEYQAVVTLLCRRRSPRALWPPARQNGPAGRGEDDPHRGLGPAQARPQICPAGAGRVDCARRKGAAKLTLLSKICDGSRLSQGIYGFAIYGRSST
jgi:hypothetical protein